MPWRELSEFRDPTIPKLANLHRARRKGLVVPSPTLWAPAADLESPPDPRHLGVGSEPGMHLGRKRQDGLAWHRYRPISVAGTRATMRPRAAAGITRMG